MIVHLSRSDSSWLRRAAGQPSHNLIDVVHPKLRHELKLALHVAARQARRVETPLLSVAIDSKEHLMGVAVEPFAPAAGA